MSQEDRSQEALTERGAVKVAGRKEGDGVGLIMPDKYFPKLIIFKITKLISTTEYNSSSTSTIVKVKVYKILFNKIIIFVSFS